MKRFHFLVKYLSNVDLFDWQFVMILHLGRIALQSVEHAGISCHVTKKQGCVKGDVSQSLSGTSVWVSDQLLIKIRVLICNTCNFTGVDLYCNLFFKKRFGTQGVPRWNLCGEHNWRGACCVGHYRCYCGGGASNQVGSCAESLRKKDNCRWNIVLHFIIYFVYFIHFQQRFLFSFPQMEKVA